MLIFYELNRGKLRPLKLAKIDDLSLWEIACQKHFLGNTWFEFDFSYHTNYFYCCEHFCLLSTSRTDLIINFFFLSETL